ncbi:MAG TPA: hypothetical protein VK666_06760 [Chryseolinea sp.]|nr:hypothetical protein [Chryseolinea sp.]
MAKSNSILGLQGTIDKLTMVRSRAYGDHVRSARGTQGEAPINESLKKEVAVITRSNRPAKILKDAIDPHRGALKGGQFWQKLVSTFRTQFNESGAFDFSNLPAIEIHKKYPLSRFISVKPEVNFDKRAHNLTVKVAYGTHPSFKKSKYIDGYRISVIGIFPDLKKGKVKSEEVFSDVIALTAKYAPITVNVPVPQKAKCYVLCLKVEGCVKGKENNTPATMGMMLFNTGKIGKG